MGEREGRTRIDGRMMMSARKRGEGRMTMPLPVTTVHNPSSVSKKWLRGEREREREREIDRVCVTKMMLCQAIARPTGPECCPQRRVVRWYHNIRLTTLMSDLASILSLLSLRPTLVLLVPLQTAKRRRSTGLSSETQDNTETFPQSILRRIPNNYSTTTT